jgi:hypothetical protein
VIAGWNLIAYLRSEDSRDFSWSYYTSPAEWQRRIIEGNEGSFSFEGLVNERDRGDVVRKRCDNQNIRRIHGKVNEDLPRSVFGTKSSYGSLP